MKIRVARQDDIPDLFEMSCKIHNMPPYDTLIPEEYRERFLRAFSRGSKFSLYFADKIASFINDDNRWVYVAEVNGRLAGYRLAEKNGNTIQLHGLFVHPDYQGRGIGRHLLMMPVENAVPGDVLCLSVLKGNDRARALYESEGFRFVREKPKRFYGAIQNVMELVIY